MVDGGSDRPPARRWPLWLGLGLVVGLLLCSVPLVLVVNLLGKLPGVPARLSGPAASPTPARSPLPGDPPAVTEAWLGERIAELLDQQAAALLRGDERGFLAVADPAAPAAADLKRQFRVLRAMRVTAWHPEIRDHPVRMDGGRGEWRVLVTYEHCFVVPACKTSPVTVGTRWVDSGSKLRLVAVEPSMSMRDGPRPWEVSDLTVAVGKRTLVATTAAYRSRLPDLLKQAEQAALVADHYAVDGTPPDRYRIFYAGPAEWKRWYGGGRPAWTGGYAVAVGGDHYDLVLNAADLHRTLVDDLLRHEMTHASSLPGKGYARGGNWWLVEGVAEYAAAGGWPVSRYEGLDNLRRLVGGRGWNGRLDTLEPAKDAADWEVGGRYGVGYLALRHLVDRFGEDRMLVFFKTVVHDGRPVEEASREAFGEDWSALQDDCVSYARSAAA